MGLLAILYWVILLLALIGFFVPLERYPRPWMSNIPAFVLFIIIGLKLFRTPLQ